MHSRARDAKRKKSAHFTLGSPSRMMAATVEGKGRDAGGRSGLIRRWHSQRLLRQRMRMPAVGGEQRWHTTKAGWNPRAGTVLDRETCASATCRTIYAIDSRISPSTLSSPISSSWWWWHTPATRAHARQEGRGGNPSWQEHHRRCRCGGRWGSSTSGVTRDLILRG